MTRRPKSSADGLALSAVRRRDARLRARPERARASAGDAGADPRDTPAHAGRRRLPASASGHRDGNLVVRRSGKSDQPRGRRRDPRRLRPQNPPLNLHGLKGPELFGGVYMSCDRLAAWRAGAPDPIRWIVISIHGIPDWASE